MITPLESVLTAKIVFLMIFTNFFWSKNTKKFQKSSDFLSLATTRNQDNVLCIKTINITTLHDEDLFCIPVLTILRQLPYPVQAMVKKDISIPV